MHISATVQSTLKVLNIHVAVFIELKEKKKWLLFPTTDSKKYSKNIYPYHYADAYNFIIPKSQY